jgi:UDP-N-acetylmuramoyl-tripeptide--D-alanyl-D-alanine ligase
MSARLIPNEIVKSTNGRLAGGSALTMLNGVCVSAGSVSPGCLFVPLTLNNADGHRNIDAALQKGAGGVLCARSSGKTAGVVKKWPGKIVVEVDDVLEALLNLACYWRHKINAIAVIGTPGSEPVLSQAAEMPTGEKKPLYVRCSSDSLHEVALQLLALNANHGWVLLELAGDCAATAERICDMSMPVAAVITADGPAARALLDAPDPPAAVFVPAGASFCKRLPDRKGIRIITCDADSGETKHTHGNGPASTHLSMARCLVRHLSGS